MLPPASRISLSQAIEIVPVEDMTETGLACAAAVKAMAATSALEIFIY
jgi:hypothetical protein